jgi:hypothetical protein
LHTAKLREGSDLHPSEYVAVRCRNVNSSDTPMCRPAVGYPEHRSEFIVKPYDHMGVWKNPVVATNPKVYRVAARLDAKVDDAIFTIRDHILSEEDLYAEFEDPEDPKTRYVMATKCRYSQRYIRACPCGICKELREKTFNKLDEFHYVHVCGYELRPQHVINARAQHATHSVREWRKAYVEHREVAMQSQQSVDSKFAPLSHNEYAGRHIADEPLPDNVQGYVGITQIFDCGTTDPTVDRTGRNRVAGPFGVKEIISDGGATRHMFHNKDHFTEYREVKNMGVRVADGKIVPILGIGRVGPLREVFHVPSLVYDLVSESQLEKEGKRLESYNGVRTVYDMTVPAGPIFLVANMSEGGLYVVNPMYLGLENPNYNYAGFTALQSKAEAIDILHKVLGHVHVERIQEMVRDGRVAWSHESAPVNLKKYSSPCVACDLAKSKRSSHTSRIRVPLEPGSLIYVDVWGPCEVMSLINMNVYTIGFIDASTKKA